jgi:hypothetical protein
MFMSEFGQKVPDLTVEVDMKERRVVWYLRFVLSIL